jgi:hypothetical protein
MMTGKEYLKEHIGETNIPEEHYENEIGEIMDWYADDYHQEQVKNLSLSGVSQHRELLLAYEIYNASEYDKKNNMEYLENLVDNYLANNYC